MVLNRVCVRTKPYDRRVPFPLASLRLGLSLLVTVLSLTVKPLPSQAAALERSGSGEPSDKVKFTRPAQWIAQNTLPREPQPPSTQPPAVPAPTPLPPPDQLLPPPPVSPDATPAVPTDVPSETVTIERFVVTGSTVFSEAELAQVTQPFTGHPISISTLFQVRSAITQLYIDKGYITSGAYIQPQKLEGGVVQIQVLEGQLEAITVTGTRRLHANYVRSRLSIVAGTPLNRNRLLEALQLLQLDPLIQSVAAELSAGVRPGESLLTVRVTEAPTLDVPLIVDNARAPSVGTDRRQIQVNEGNLTGLGDRLSVAYTNTNGSNTVDLNYALPINPRNGTISFSYGNSSSTVIEPPFDVLNIDSRSRYYELTLRQPIAQTATHEFALGLTATRRESEATLLNGLIPFPALGADNDGKTRLTALRFFQEMTWRSSVEVIALRSQFTVGLNALNATINPDPPDSRFFAWRGQTQWVRLLAPETLLLVRGDLQLADRPLLPLEQFSLGGQDSVRGYRQDALLTDNGLFASAEVRIPILRLPKINSLLQLTPFIDLGTAWNRSDRRADAQTLAALGLGLRFQFSDRLTARFEWGVPLTSLGGEKNTLQEKGLYFSVVVHPF